MVIANLYRACVQVAYIYSQVLRDAVQTFRSNIGVEGDLSLDIRRQFILHDALMEARKQSFSPDKAITVCDVPIWSRWVNITLD